MPEWLNDASKLSILRQLYPEDAIKRAKSIGSYCSSIGAYSPSNGLVAVREAVAEFIKRRDGFPANPNHIYLTNGASEGIARILNVIVSDPQVGVMIPIPQYPLYTATLAMLNARPVEYFLDETQGWTLTTEELQRALNEGRQRGCDVRALVIINPGNPTGSCLSRERLQDIVRFCHRERLVLLSDEVYQENIYDPVSQPFFSAKRVLCEMGPAYAENVELVSFHSASKGLLGECGRRGGYFECFGLDEQVMEQLFKVASVSLCSNVLGQVMVSLMVDPPKKGDESYEMYRTEREAIWGA